MVEQRTATKQATADSGSRFSSYAAHFVPKLVIALREGYPGSRFGADALAGLTVAILALPLSMAIAIAAGVTPDRGLITSVVAGFLISALGGSRYQIGGPAAAFIVIIASVIDKHGPGGLMTATFLAGFLLIAAALLKLGSYIKYVPGPVILGFTSGIGVIIAIGQIKDFLGIDVSVTTDIIGKLGKLWEARGSVNLWALLIGCLTLGIISATKYWRPKWPGLLIAVGVASGIAWLIGTESHRIATIGSRFGGIPNALPSPELPDLSWTKITEVLPSAFTIAFLVGVESLLSAVAADAKTGGRHRSNVELLAQGVANVASPLFGGLPATGVIARTATNITAGGKTPVSGVLHAVFVLLFMLLLAPLAGYLALSCLAAVLLNVSWRLIDWREVSHFLARAPVDDRLVLIATLALTIFVDLNVAIAVGVVLACMLFMHRMAEVSGAAQGAGHPDDLDDMRGGRSVILDMQLPPRVSVFQMRGPLFFGGASTISETLRALDQFPSVLILRMRDVPLVDATALSALEDLALECRKRGCRIIVSGLQRQPREAMHRMGMLRRHKVVLASNSFMALEKAKAMVA